jgi:7-carboxy-7-deazaguanine synthase
MTAVKSLELRWPVVEIFGPTIQGEGVDQGVVAHFVRFGGCDFRCTWCDTPHAVLPEEVRANATKMSAHDIAEDLGQRSAAPWVILTGGNPALHDLEQLVDELHDCGFLVAVETQGSRWREWMRKLDRVCVSPKPPSSLEPKAQGVGAFQRFLEEGMKARLDGKREFEWLFLKVVVFNDEDLDYAERVRSQLSDAMLYLSAGNDAGRTVGNPKRHDTRKLSGIRRDLCDQYWWLVEEIFKRPRLCQSDVVVQAQMHVLAWGNQKGH